MYFHLSIVASDSLFSLVSLILIFHRSLFGLPASTATKVVLGDLYSSFEVYYNELSRVESIRGRFQGSRAHITVWY